ncbi:MAG: hypothetical protein Q8N60_03490 [Candidatus Diapherotrites archaeon]|nr:hypothetical protein [Candidatus Diapherotrites archaeon]
MREKTETGTKIKKIGKEKTETLKKTVNGKKNFKTKKNCLIFRGN